MDDFMCDLNNGHVLYNPRQLPCICGLTACTKCIKLELDKSNDKNEYACKQCNSKYIIKDVTELPKNVKIENLIYKNIFPLTQLFMQNASESLKKSEGKRKKLNFNKLQFLLYKMALSCLKIRTIKKSC